MVERRAPTTAKVQALIQAHADVVDAHHTPGGGANVKSGTLAANTGANSVTFTTPFASVPRVVLTVQDAGLALRDCLYKVTLVSTTGFEFEVDAAATYAWLATDAENS